MTPRELTGRLSCLYEPPASPRGMFVTRERVDRLEARLSRPLAWPLESLLFSIALRRARDCCAELKCLTACVMHGAALLFCLAGG